MSGSSNVGSKLRWNPCRVLLGLRLRCLSTLHVFVRAFLHFGLHGLELLLLRVIQSSFYLGIRILVNRLHLAVPILWRKRLILPELLRLLIAAFKNRLDLGLLIGCQIQLLSQVLQLRFRVHPVTMSPLTLALLGRRRSGVVLSEGSAASQ